MGAAGPVLSGVNRLGLAWTSHHADRNRPVARPRLPASAARDGARRPSGAGRRQLPRGIDGAAPAADGRRRHAAGARRRAQRAADRRFRARAADQHAGRGRSGRRPPDRARHAAPGRPRGARQAAHRRARALRVLRAGAFGLRRHRHLRARFLRQPHPAQRRRAANPRRVMSSTRIDPLAVRRLGKSPLSVTQLGVGTAPLGDLYQRVPEPDARGMLEAGYDLGLRLFDTAPLYGSGLAEHRTGGLLRQKPRDGLVVSTKVGRWYRPAPGGANRGNWAGGLEFNAVLDYSYDGAMRSFEQSLLRLGLPRVDVLLIHDVDVHTHRTRELCDRYFDQAMAGAYRALEELRRNGDVKAIGVGVNEADMCARFARAGDFDCMLLAGRYTLLEQGALEEFLPLCEQKNIGVLAGGTFNSGILASYPRSGARYNYSAAPPQVVERVGKIAEVCAAHGVSLAAAAIQFPLAHPKVSSVVIGAVSRAEIQQNFELMRTPIPPALWTDLKGAGLLSNEAPVPR